MRAVRRSGRRKMDKIEKGLHSKTKQKQKREKEKRKVPRGEWRLYTLHFCTLQKKQSSTCYKLNILHNIHFIPQRYYCTRRCNNITTQQHTQHQQATSMEHGRVVPKKASRWVWGSPLQPPEADSFGDFVELELDTTAVNFDKFPQKPKRAPKS